MKNSRGRPQKKGPAPARREGPPRGAAAKPVSGRRPPSHGGAAPERRGIDRARWVVGIHSSAESIRVRPRGIREVWIRDDWASSQALRELHEAATHARLTIKEKSSGNLDHVGHGHQGIAVACTESPKINWDKLAEPGPTCVLLLDGLEDPQNLGSILRTAWLLGVQGIFIPSDRAVALTPSVCKIASGGAEHVAVESDMSLPSVMEQLKERGFWIYGLAEAGKSRPWDLKLPEKAAWVIGSESSGIRKPVERACDELVRIPQVATGSSFNASIAAAIALAETSRQHGRPE